MPLITRPAEPPKKEQIRIRLTKEVLSDIDAYCHWQNIDRDYFIEQAALEIFKRDKEWKEHREKSS